MNAAGGAGGEGAHGGVGGVVGGEEKTRASPSPPAHPRAPGSVGSSKTAATTWSKAAKASSKALPSNMSALSDMAAGTVIAEGDEEIDGPVEALESKTTGRGHAAEAVLTLPSAPGLSLRKILDEVDASQSPHTVVCYMFNTGAEESEGEATERACRPLTLLRPNKDIIVLPMGSTIVQDLWAWACDALGYQLWQAVWVPFDFSALPYPTQQREKLYELVVAALRTMPLVSATASFAAAAAEAGEALVSSTDDRPELILVPFRKPKKLLELCEEAGIHVFGDVQDGLLQKDVLHPRPDAMLKGNSPLTGHLLHPESKEPLPIRVPRGFTCFNRTELAWAVEAMEREGLRIVFKPSWGSSGKGILMNFTAADLEKLSWDPEKGPVAVEEYIDADRKSDGELLLPVIHCLARSQFGDIVEQLITGTTSYNGTASPCRVEDMVRDKVDRATGLLADTLDMQGFWGVDYLLKDGEPILIDLNSGRPNGGHVPKIFCARFAPGKPFLFWKEKHTPIEARVSSIYSKLIELGLVFNKKERRGITVMSCLPGGLSSFIAIGDSDEEVAKLRDAWRANYDDIMLGAVPSATAGGTD